MGQTSGRWRKRPPKAPRSGSGSLPTAVRCATRRRGPGPKAPAAAIGSGKCRPRAGLRKRSGPVGWATGRRTAGTTSSRGGMPRLVSTMLWVVRERPRLPWAPPRAVRFTHAPLDFIHIGAGRMGGRCTRGAARYRGELQRLDPASGHLTPYLGGLSAADLAVSADGQWLAWIAFPEGTLWRARVDGSERQQLTAPPLLANLPRFSPDGRRIVFVGRVPDESGNSIWVIPLSGGDPEVLATPSQPGRKLVGCLLAVGWAGGGLFKPVGAPAGSVPDRLSNPCDRTAARGGTADMAQVPVAGRNSRA